MALPLEKKSIGYLTSQYRQPGVVTWMGIRPVRTADLRAVDKVKAIASQGLHGDHYNSEDGKRQVTLIQQEHIEAVASMLGLATIHPGLLRRNIVVKGLNLLALKDQKFRLGEAVLEYSGLCHPCSRMEENLGEGGYNALRGHGGITARIIASGEIALGDSLEAF